MLTYLLILLISCKFNTVNLRSLTTTLACGTDTGQTDKWRWHVTVSHRMPNSETPVCGGSLLNDLYVITSAHCLFDLTGKKIDSSLLVVSYKLGSKLINVSIAKSFLPKEFGVNQFESDIALIKMKTSVTIGSNIEPICLNQEDDITPSDQLVIPIQRKNLADVTSVQMEVTNYNLCNETTEYIFESTYKHFICAGNFGNSSTDKFQINRGSGIQWKKNNKWYLIGVLLYTVGPNENESAFAGGILLKPYANWINKIINRHLMPTISDQKCEQYKRIFNPKLLKPLFAPSISLADKYEIVNPACYGTLISERFILTAASCAKSTRIISLQYGILETEFHKEFKFHFHPEDENHQRIALVELRRNASNLEHFINCLWTNEDDRMGFYTNITHNMSFLKIENIRVLYKPEEDVYMSIGGECHDFTISLASKPGDVLAVKKHGEEVKRVVGLISNQLTSCRPTRVLNVVSYLQWIEETVWRN